MACLDLVVYMGVKARAVFVENIKKDTVVDKAAIFALKLKDRLFAALEGFPQPFLKNGEQVPDMLCLVCGNERTGDTLVCFDSLVTERVGKNGASDILEKRLFPLA